MRWLSTLMASLLFGALASAAVTPVQITHLAAATPSQSLPPQPECLGEVGGRYVFWATDAAHGRELWVSDGTPAGTSLLVDLDPGPQDATIARAHSEWSPTTGGSAVLGGALYFTAYDHEHGISLWTTDGTVAGTGSVAWLGFGNDATALTVVSDLAVCGGSIYVGTSDPMLGTKLWQCDGTPAGTRIVHDFGAQPLFWPSIRLGITHIAACGASVVFDYSDHRGEVSIWRSDGTDAGTVEIGSIAAQAGLYMPAVTGIVGVPGRALIHLLGAEADLVSTDLSTLDTVALPGVTTDYRMATGSYGAQPAIYWSTPTQLGCLVADGSSATFNVGVGGVASMAAPPGDGIVISSGDGVLAYDSTGADPTQTIAPSGGEVWKVGSSVWFQDPVSGDILVTDGTAAGTSTLAHLAAGGVDGWLAAAPVGGAGGYFLSVSTVGHDPEPWFLAPGSAPVVLADIGTRSGGSFFEQMATLGERIVFFAYHDGADFELHAATASPGSDTVLVSGLSSASPTFEVIGSRAFFLGIQQGDYQFSLWVTDGTSAGTVRLTSPGVDSMCVAQGKVFFLVDDFIGAGIHQLWTSDGTLAGTAEAFDFDDLPDLDFYGAAVLPLGDRVVFGGYGGYGEALWVSDGTLDGTTLLSRAPGSIPLWGVGNPDHLYFFSADSSSDHALWVTDGTVDGTHAVWSGRADDGLGWWSMSAKDGRALFSSFWGFPGLWVSDGTGTGTQQLVPDFHSDDAAHAVPLGHGWITVVYDIEHGAEPWVSDGTPAGTHLLVDLNPGPEGSYVTSMVAVDAAHVVLEAYRPDVGWALWTTDGTPVGTVLLTSIPPGLDPTTWIWPGLELAPQGRTLGRPCVTASGTLFFVADAGSGLELWSIALPFPIGGTTASGGSGGSSSGGTPTATGSGGGSTAGYVPETSGHSCGLGSGFAIALASIALALRPLRRR